MIFDVIRKLYFKGLDSTALKFPCICTKLNLSAILVVIFCFSQITVSHYDKIVYQTLIRVHTSIIFYLVDFKFLDDRISIDNGNLQYIIHCPMMEHTTIGDYRNPL